MKWKHFLIENDLNLKGKVPRWFKRIEEVIIEDHLMRKIKDKYIESEKNFKEIHIKLYDEDEKINKNDVISWNNNQGFPIFGMDKKKSRSKNLKRIGYHMKIKDEGGGVDIDNSPELVRCKGYDKNIKKKFKEGEEKFCLIYLNNQDSRIIRKRAEGQVIKPYESLRNIMSKNDIVKKYTNEKIQDEFFNWRIDLIDK